MFTSTLLQQTADPISVWKLSLDGQKQRGLETVPALLALRYITK